MEKSKWGEDLCKVLFSSKQHFLKNMKTVSADFQKCLWSHCLKRTPAGQIEVHRGKETEREKENEQMETEEEKLINTLTWYDCWDKWQEHHFTFCHSFLCLPPLYPPCFFLPPSVGFCPWPYVTVSQTPTPLWEEAATGQTHSDAKPSPTHINIAFICGIPKGPAHPHVCFHSLCIIRP